MGAAERALFPVISLGVPAVGGGTYALEYRPEDYLFSLGKPTYPYARDTFAALLPFPNITECGKPGWALVAWGLIPAQESVILAQDLYNNCLHYHNFDNSTLGMARLSSGGAERR